MSLFKVKLEGDSKDRIGKGKRDRKWQDSVESSKQENLVHKYGIVLN